MSCGGGKAHTLKCKNHEDKCRISSHPEGGLEIPIPLSYGGRLWKRSHGVTPPSSGSKFIACFFD